MQVTAIYPGTFDPMTVGHMDVATRASKMFDDLIIGVAGDPSNKKSPFFDLDERVAMASEVLADLPNVPDFDYEVQIAGVNRHLSPSVETVFIAASQDFTFLSSSIVREIAKLDGNYSDFVHPVVKKEFERKLRS